MPRYSWAISAAATGKVPAFFTVQETVARTSKRVGLPPWTMAAGGGRREVETLVRRVVRRLE